MDAVEVIKVCVRRWYVMLPILIAAAGVSYQLLQAEETTYTASASYGLVQPSLTPGSDEEETPNPLGDGGSALIGAAIEAQLNSRETQDDLGSDDTRGWGPGEAVNHRSYDVEIPQFETTYEVRTWGEDEAEVREVVDRVIGAAPDLADELQVRAGVPPPQRYQPFVLAPTQVDALPATSGAKLVIAVMGVGLLMGAAWSIVVDRGLHWRRAHRQAVRTPEASPGGAVAVPSATAERASEAGDAPPGTGGTNGTTVGKAVNGSTVAGRTGRGATTNRPATGGTSKRSGTGAKARRPRTGATATPSPKPGPMAGPKAGPKPANRR